MATANNIETLLNKFDVARITQLDTIAHGPECCPESGECAARAALDLRAGRSLSDADWADAKDRLLEFFNILRGWDRQARTGSGALVTCEVLCLPEH